MSLGLRPFEGLGDGFALKYRKEILLKKMKVIKCEIIIHAGYFDKFTGAKIVL